GTAARLTPAALAAALEAYVSPVLAYPPDLCPGAAAAVRELAARGVSLGIVSNTGRTPGVILRRVLERHGLLGHFGAISYSDEVGVRKPEPEIFRATLASAGVPAAEAVHIGDNPEADVIGAQGVGMRAAHYTAGFRAPAARADLVVADLGALPDEVFRIASRRAGG
ncbi:MAG: HAD family hydrolase, partial [Candidatus Rokuibacteriota bacterium]